MNENFGVGAVLGTGFRVYARNIIPFTLITALVYLPMIIWTYVTFSDDHLSLAQIQHWQYAEPLVKLVLGSFVSATLTYGVVKELQGERATIGACIATGFKRMLPALGVGIATGLAVVVGTILLIIPGLMALCILYVATPASVIEKPGVFGALRRSGELTKGYRWQIFGLVLLLFILGWGAVKILESAFTPMATMHQVRTFALGAIGLDVLLTALGSVIAAVAYTMLRGEKEGTSANDLASVFE